MGMFDRVVVLDEILRCPHGHPVEGFQTKSFDDPVMDTYLLEGAHVYRVGRGGLGGEDDETAKHWRLEENQAVFTRRHSMEAIAPPTDLVFYTSCGDCTPVLVRHDRPRAWGDLVDERQLWVEFRATFGADGARHIERTSGTRDDLAAELREDGLRVLRDDEPLALAHYEFRAAREESPAPRRGGRRR